MRAVAYQTPHPIDHPAALLDIELPTPSPQGRDILVAVQAIAVNPVDTKVRANRSAAAGEWVTLGWDASGIVEAVGPDVVGFRPGDRVWYAGDLQRAGSYAEYQLVDERLVGHMPHSLDFATAASLPLTAITAWEMLFDRLQLRRDDPTPGQLLVIGAAGGVGSIMVQLARQLTNFTVIGTASRVSTQEWVLAAGAHHVIDHSQPLAPQLSELGFAQVSHVVCLTHTDEHYAQIVEILAPQGHFGLIDDPATLLDIRLLKRKSIALHWELMFTRSLYQTADMAAQQALLNQVAQLVDAGQLKPTVGEHFGLINAANLRRAHALLESGQARGKIVLSGFAG